MDHEASAIASTTGGTQARGRFFDYKGKSCAEYINCIANWYAQEHAHQACGLISSRQLIEKLFKGEKCCDDRRILFVVAKMSPRVVKIASALKGRNYSLEILFYQDKAFRSNQTQYLIKYIDSYYVCKCAEELMYRAALSKAGVLHCFTGMDADIAAVLIQRKELFPKIVHDKYDIVCGMYNDIKRKELFETDRYCLEHADALCCRGYEHEYLAREEGFQIKGAVLQLFDYCDSSHFCHSSTPGIPLSLCYAGNLVTEKTHPGSALACTLEFAELCRKNRCAFHIYPNKWDTDLYADYIELGKNNPYFHIHKPVAFESLSKELSQYDYGVIPVKRISMISRGDCFISRNKYIYSATNKLFDSIDAGLPIIAATPLKLAEYLQKKGALMKWWIEDFDFDKLRLIKEKGTIYKRVENIRKELTIDNHIDELLQFYRKLAKNSTEEFVTGDAVNHIIPLREGSAEGEI